MELENTQKLYFYHALLRITKGAESKKRGGRDKNSFVPRRAGGSIGAQDIFTFFLFNDQSPEAFKVLITQTLRPASVISHSHKLFHPLLLSSPTPFLTVQDDPRGMVGV